jgi:hypothetical protein
MTRWRIDITDRDTWLWATLCVLGTIWLGFLLLTGPVGGHPGTLLHSCNPVISASDSDEVKKERGYNDPIAASSRKISACNVWRIERLAWSVPAAVLTTLVACRAMIIRRGARSA